MIAPWPAVDEGRKDRRIDSQFVQFQEVLRALREIRSRQNIAPRLPIEFSVRCEPATAELLAPMESYFESLAKATAVGWGEEVSPPATSAHVARTGVEVFVDLKDFIDEDAERARLEKEKDRLAGQIAGTEKKLANEKFVQRAPAEVVQRERDRLAQLKENLAAVEKALEKLNS
jgi:valyl-tRNA synthetase